MTRGRNSAKSDINQLINEANYSEIGHGKTKSEYHNEAREAGAKTFHEVSYETPFKHSKTLYNNKRILTNFNQYIRQEFKCYSIKETTPQMVDSYLSHKINDDNLQLSTFMRNTCPAMNNLEAMLNRVGVPSNFQDVIKNAKVEALDICAPSDRSSRSYGDNAESIINEIKDETAKFCCHLQLEYGLRANESFKIHLTGNINEMCIHQKGGHRTIKEISPQDYNKLIEMSKGRTDFYITNYSKLQYQFQTACERLGIDSNGLHGLRATYACRSYDRHISEGLNDSKAKACVSVELGHERLKIVNEYLRGR